MALVEITVTFNYRTTAGAEATGAVTFEATQQITDGTSVVDPSPQVVTLASGSGSVVLEVAPPSSTYRVTERITNASPNTYTITVPSNASGGTVALASLIS